MNVPYVIDGDDFLQERLRKPFSSLVARVKGSVNAKFWIPKPKTYQSLTCHKELIANVQALL